MKFTNNTKEVSHIVTIMEQCFDALKQGAIACIFDQRGESHEGLIMGAETANNLPHSPDIGSLIRIK